MSKLLKLNQQVKTCRLCRLCRTRLNGVPGEGNENADFMFIGEGPGFNEDREGRPFVGQAGQFLEELLAVAGLKREEVYITNVVKCRPPQNRDPLPDEIDACAPYLERQMALINPLVVVTLGRYSMARFFPNDRITAVAGQARYNDGRLVVTMLHPAYALRNVDAKDQMRDHFRKLPAMLEQARRKREAGPDAVEEQPMDPALVAAIHEQQLNEIEARLREEVAKEAAATPAHAPEQAADPYAYVAAVKSRKARKPDAPRNVAPVAAIIEPEAHVVAEPVLEAEQAAEIVTEAAPIEVSAEVATAVVAPEAEAAIIDPVASPELESPALSEATAEPESVASIELYEGETIIVAPAEVEQPQVAAETEPEPLAELAIAEQPEIAEPEAIAAVTADEAEPVAVAAAEPEAAADETPAEEPQPKAAPAKKGKKNKPDNEVVQLSLF